MRFSEKYKVLDLISYTFNNILYSILNKSNNNNSSDEKENSGIKNIVFNMPFSLSIGGGMNLLNLGLGPPVPSPYLSKVDSSVYTLVLDLDETLIHYFYTPSGGSFLIRPYCIQFLEEMSKIFEVIIFTAAMKDVRIFCNYFSMRIILLIFWIQQINWFNIDYIDNILQ